MINIYTVFHISLLEQAVENQLEGQNIPLPPPNEVERKEEYDIEEVLNTRVYEPGLQYLIHWTGYDQPDRLDARDVNELEAVNQFYEWYPGQPGALLQEVYCNRG